MLPIIVQNGAYFVWKASDWLCLRENNRIIGNLTGCLGGLPRQNVFQGLPLYLLKEEVTLLLEKNIVCLLSDKAYFDEPDKKTIEKFDLYREQNSKEQTACYEEQRKHQITIMIDRIIEGKRRKLLGLSTKKKKKGNSDENVKVTMSDLELDREEILRNELNKSAACSSPPVLVQTFTSEQWMEKDTLERVQWSFPSTTQEKLKYNTFKDLWEKGFYITDGHKFGVDYLVYPGDPVKFHAQFIVVCVEYNKSIPCVEFIAYARLASISRKTFVIASQEPSTDIVYQSIQWTERN